MGLELVSSRHTSRYCLLMYVVVTCDLGTASEAPFVSHSTFARAQVCAWYITLYALPAALFTMYPEE